MRLDQRLLVALLIAGALPLGLFCFRTLADARAAEASALEFQQTLVTAHAGDIRQFIQVLNTNLAFAVELDRRPAMTKEERQAIFINALTHRVDIAMISLLDHQGRVLSQVSAETTLTKTPDRGSDAAFQDAVQSRQARFGRSVMAGEQLYVRVYYPLLDGNLLDVLARTHTLFERLRAVRLGSTGRLWLADADGHNLLSPDMDLSESRYTKTSVAIPELGWTLGFSQEKREAFATRDHLKQTALLDLFVAMLCLFIGAFHLQRTFHTLSYEAVSATDEKRIARLREDTVRMMTHDLRTPLTGVQGFIRLFLSEWGQTLTEPQRDLLEKSDLAATDMLDNLSNILDVRKYEQGELRLDIDPTPIDRLLKETEVKSGAMFRAKHITFTVQGPPHGGLLEVDREQLKRVINNLLGNAVKFTAEGGHVRLSAEDQGQGVLWKVEDNGRGIAADQLDHLFKPYQQAGKQDRLLGTGLGLAICKMIVEAHHGRIQVISQIGKGSRFEFWIPRQQPS